MEILALIINLLILIFVIVRLNGINSKVKMILTKLYFNDGEPNLDKMDEKKLYGLFNAGIVSTKKYNAAVKRRKQGDR